MRARTTPNKQRSATSARRVRARENAGRERGREKNAPGAGPSSKSQNKTVFTPHSHACLRVCDQYQALWSASARHHGVTRDKWQELERKAETGWRACRSFSLRLCLGAGADNQGAKSRSVLCYSTYSRLLFGQATARLHVAPFVCNQYSK